MSKHKLFSLDIASNSTTLAAGKENSIELKNSLTGKSIIELKSDSKVKTSQEFIRVRNQ
jgi:hypothetical protein